MTIVYVHRTQGRGVEGVHIWGIVRALGAAGHRVRVFGPAGETPDPRIAANLANSSDDTPTPDKSAPPSRLSRLFGAISAHTPETVFELLEIGYNAVALTGLIAKAGRGPVSMVYERYAIFAMAGWLFARLRGCPWVLEVNYTARSPLVRQRSRLLKPLAVSLDGFLFRRADAIATVSRALRDELIEYHGVPAARIAVTPNCTDPDRFTPQATPPQTIAGVSCRDKRIIGFVGGFYPWHGLPLLLDAFETLSAARNDLALVLIGDGPERAAIERAVAEKGLSSRVLLPGWIDHDALPSYVAGFHVGVMPDSNDYGSPMKILEYMAAGCPVVAPDYGPVLEVVQEDVQGRIFAKRDGASLAAALAPILDDPATRARMAAAARQSVLDRHSWSVNVDAVFGLLEAAGPAVEREHPAHDQR